MQTFTFKKVGDIEIKADVYLPSHASDTPIPIVIWWHGGGLLMGDRTVIAPHTKRAPEDPSFPVCVVSAEYRLAPQVSIVEIVEDVRDVIVWARTELPRLLGDGVVDPTRLAATGGSAGGYLALLAALPVAGVYPLPKCIGAVYPITNPAGPYFSTPQRPGPPSIGGRTISTEEMAEHLNPAGPVLAEFALKPPIAQGSRGDMYSYMLQEGNLATLLTATAPEGTNIESYNVPPLITSTFPPTYVYHGVVDWRVGIEQSHKLVLALKTNNVEHDYQEVAGPEGQHLTDVFDPSFEMPALYSFLKQHL